VRTGIGPRHTLVRGAAVMQQRAEGELKLAAGRGKATGETQTVCEAALTRSICAYAPFSRIYMCVINYNASDRGMAGTQ
jgi:hypothetical protein